jgi:adenylosuccinate synthase
MTEMITIDFKEMDKDDLEFRVSSAFTPKIPSTRFVVISPEEARQLYFGQKGKKTNGYLIVGGQKGDEGKGMATEIVHLADPNIGWTMAPNSTHNAGKGVHTKDIDGKDVKVSLHLCPATLPNPDIKNYIGRNTQLNPISLENEILDCLDTTGRKTLGVDYHLMVDSYCNLVVPTNRADDVVGKPDAMGSTVVGATASKSNAAGKSAPLLEHVLYDPLEFKRLVNKQIREFEDRLQYDGEFSRLGISNITMLGLAISNEDIYQTNKRLEALAKKLSKTEIDFFSQQDPAQFLLDKYKEVIEKDLFYIGDCNAEINRLLAQGIPGNVEAVQSSLLSNDVKYSKNRTGANTHGEGTKGDAGLDPSKIKYIKILAMKFGNTSVGGNERTMSGFIKQDSLAALEAEQDGKMISFEKTDTLGEFLTKEQADQAFYEITRAFHHAIENGYSINNSRARIKGINMKLSLGEANALLTAYRWGEKGETSKRARICRFDDMVETGVVYSVEGTCFQIRNAIDRAMDLPQIGIVTAYEVIRAYGGYNIGDIITPGMQLRQEHLTIESCIPIIDFIPSWNSITTEGPLKPGAELNPPLVHYLKLVSGNNTVIAIGAGKEIDHKVYVKEVTG